MLPNTNTSSFFTNTSRLGLDQAPDSSSCKRADRKSVTARQVTRDWMCGELIVNVFRRCLVESQK